MMLMIFRFHGIQNLMSLDKKQANELSSLNSSILVIAMLGV